MPISGKTVVKVLKKHGWTEVSQKGSHIKLKKDKQAPVVIPVHGNKDLGKGLIKSIEKQTGEKLI